jgi:type II secretory pathway pseudopilin PulG
MKIRIRLVVFGLIAAVLLPVFAMQNSHAEDLSDDQINRIQANCLSIKGSLNQLHASDALLRVNRGQIYESVGTKLMSSFNSRLSNNSLDNKGLVVVTNQYQTALTTFRSDYQAYEQQLSATIRIDCAKEPTNFHNALLDARVKRDIVHTDVTRLNQYIDDYRSAVNDFMINFDRVTGKN